MATKIFGHIEDVPVGAWFINRTALAASGVHPPPMSGIHGTKVDGADSIVVSGGYVDDEDLGQVIIYTGAGGQDKAKKRQVEDQSLSQHGNAGLVTSMLRGLPVRVSRGAHRASEHAPAIGFRYDGLFSVVDQWVQASQDGPLVIRFRLEKLDDLLPASGPSPTADASTYATTTVTRRVRDSAQSRAVKSWHEDKCQICGVVLTIADGRRYSEGAHIKPLGKPHEGPDTTSNLLCLCPNHHAQLDYGGLMIGDDLRVTDRQSGRDLGRLRTNPRHLLDEKALAYRRDLHAI